MNSIIYGTFSKSHNSKSIDPGFIYYSNLLCKDILMRESCGKDLFSLKILVYLHVSPVNKAIISFHFSLHFFSPGLLPTPRETEWIMSQLLELFSPHAYSLSHLPLSQVPIPISLLIGKLWFLIIWNFLKYLLTYMCMLGSNMSSDNTVHGICIHIT